MTPTAADPSTYFVRRVAAARRRRDKADAELRSAMTAARGAGATLQQIADAANVSRQRIHKILSRSGE